MLPATFTIARSTTALAVTVAVPVLFPGVVSVAPVGTLTLAVFVSTPVALAVACTWNVTVTVPPAGIVTEPLIAVVLVVKLAVVAPPLTAVCTLVTVPSPLGRVSMKLEPVAVLGPELLITRL